MLRLIISVIILSIAAAGIFIFTVPLTKEISTLKTEASSFNEALGNSKALENERDKLTQKYNSILPENLSKIEKLLPDSVDNIRLILEIEKIAIPYGMVLKEIKYDSLTKKDSGAQPESLDPEVNQLSRKEYGVWSLEFVTSATYNNYLAFIKDLEANLRIVDIASIQFSANLNQGVVGINPNLPEVYKYGFKIKTYWLKN